jgi:hypothetical protein
MELLELGDRLARQLDDEISTCPKGLEMFMRPLSRTVGRMVRSCVDGAQGLPPARVSRQLTAAYEAAQALVNVLGAELSGELRG